jgi:hypothetical protein
MPARLTTISLALLITLFASCKKNDPPAKLSYTAGIGGTRNWHGSHFYEASGMHYPTPVNEFYYFPDTSFAITVINDTAIQLAGTTFAYQAKDSVNHIYFFGTAYYYYMYNMGIGIAYYYTKDSLVYCHGDLHGTSDYWKLQDLYYTY